MSDEYISILREAVESYREAHHVQPTEINASIQASQSSEWCADHWRRLLRIAVAMDNCAVLGVSERRLSDIVGRSLYIQVSLTSRGNAAQPYHNDTCHVARNPLRSIGLSRMDEGTCSLGKYRLNQTIHPESASHAYYVAISPAGCVIPRTIYPFNDAFATYVDLSAMRRTREMKRELFKPKPLDSARIVVNGTAYFNDGDEYAGIKLESIVSDGFFSRKNVAIALFQRSWDTTALKTLRQTIDRYTGASIGKLLYVETIPAWALNHLIDVLAIEKTRLRRVR